MSPNFIIKTFQSALGPKPVGPYSTAVQLNNVLHLSGVIGIEKTTSKLIEGGIKAETQLVFHHIKTILEECGTSLDKVATVKIYVDDMRAVPFVNEIYEQYINPPFPARVMMEVSKLPMGAKIEVEVSAVVGDHCRL